MQRCPALDVWSLLRKVCYLFSLKLLHIQTCPKLKVEAHMNWSWSQKFKVKALTLGAPKGPGGPKKDRVFYWDVGITYLKIGAQNCQEKIHSLISTRFTNGVTGYTSYTLLQALDHKINFVFLTDLRSDLWICCSHIPVEQHIRRSEL